MVASEGRRLARNSVLLGAGDAAAMALGFATTILVTDQLGEDGYGLLLGAQRLVLFLLVIAQFGLYPLLVRGVASGRDEPGTILGTLLTLRVGLGAVYLAGVAVAAAAFDYMVDHRWLLYAVAGMELVGTVSQLIMGLCEGKERMGRSALIVLSRSIVLFVGVLWVAFTDGGLLAIAIVYGVGRCLELVVAVLLAPGAAPGIRLRVRKPDLFPTLRDAVPFVIVGLAFMAMRSIDVTMLTSLASVAETSRYGAALNFTDMLLIVPVLVQRALLPVFSRLQHSGGGTDVARDTIIVFSAVMVPAAIGLSLLSDTAVALYPSGEFAKSAAVLEILALPVLFYAPMNVCATFLTGAGRLWIIVACYALALPIQFAINLWLIDSHGAVGVAAGTAGAHLILAILLVGAVRPLGLRIPGASMARHALAAAVMAAVVFPLREQFLLLPVIAGGVTYGLVLLALTRPDHLERRLVADAWSRIRSR